MLPELLLALIKIALINMNMVHRAPLLQQYACDFFSCRFPLPFSRGQKIKKNVGEGRLPATFNYTTRADKQWVDVSSGVAFLSSCACSVFTRF